MKIVQDLGNYYRKNRTNLRRTYRKKTHLWTVIQKKKIRVSADFGAISLIQMILMSLENVWMIGMITNKERKQKEMDCRRKGEHENGTP